MKTKFIGARDLEDPVRGNGEEGGRREGGGCWANRAEGLKVLWSGGARAAYIQKTDYKDCAPGNIGCIGALVLHILACRRAASECPSSASCVLCSAWETLALEFRLRHYFVLRG